tara:strand:- start:570 stop:800 length:231 start_codon:yes stop_codon:yes gene_type:complete
MTKYISYPAFFISLAIGLFLIYLFGPETKDIFIYPTPENVENILFKDKVDNCFYLDPQEIKCPDSKEEIHKIPVQT